MYDIIKRYVENENSNGLMLVDMPTGSGKTYSAIQFVYNSCMNEDNSKRKYIFVTTLKKNLPHEDLKAFFVEAGKSELYKEKVLVINSNMDSVIDGWSDEVDRHIPVEIKKTDEYKRFCSDLNFVKKQRADKKYDLREFLSCIESNLREKSEPAFRRLISDYLGKEYPTVDDKIMAIKTKERWQWLGKLYPAVFTKDRQVLFMSMDKFLSRNTTIVEPSYMFYNSDVIKDAVIFIDEFDATKDTMLKNIIENGLRDKVNYIELFKDIYSALHTDEFPVVLTTPSKQRLEGAWKNQSLEAVVDGIQEKADDIFKTYSLQFKHRTDGDVDDNYQNYMFQDHQFHSILGNQDKRFITMNCDDKQKINTITFEKNKPSMEKNNIQSMLGQLRGFVSYFQRGVYILAVNYMQRKNEQRKPGEDAFTMEYAIRSVLNLFRLSRDSVDYLTTQIMIASHKVKGNIAPADFDLSFYENGFRYYAFENNTDHDMQSQIMMYSFQNTPEKMLLRFCEKAKVIGISATATVPSVLGNFDISYLKDKLQKLFIELTDEERTRLSEKFQKDQNYIDVNVKATLLGSKDKYAVTSWFEIFRDKEIAEYVYDMLQRTFGENEDGNDYNKERYLRVAHAFKEFVIHEDIKSFLCVLTMHPKPGNKSLDKNKLHEIFKMIALENGWNNYHDSTIVYLDGDEYDDKKNELIQRLSQGQKIFVISVYQTIGAGQNLQYPVPDFLKTSVVKVNERNRVDEKDFDAIYLDKPTNLIVQLGDNLEESDFAKYLFQMEFLQEKGELSSDETIRNVKRAFKTFMMGHINRDQYANVYKKKSVVLLSTRYIIQAIGRICRTNQKNRNVYVYADNRIAENIDVSVVQGRVFNHEFIVLIDAIRAYKEVIPEQTNLESLASLKAVRVNKEIKNMLNNDWNQDKIEKWQTLRNLVLCNPTATREDAERNFVLKNFYVEMPKKANYLYYNQEEDYNNVSVSFARDVDHQMRLSEEGSKLQEMLEIPGVRDKFISEGWAVTYEPNDYIMTPPLWNNIYKGVLGEVVGKYLFERVLKVELEEITNPDLFELFDYVLPGDSVYVDFKNWHELITEERNTMLRKIADKAKKCACKCVIVANIIADKEWRVSEVDIDGVHILTVPYLVKKTDGKVLCDTNAWNAVRRCVDEYEHKIEQNKCSIESSNDK